MLKNSGNQAWHRGYMVPPGTQSENLLHISYIVAHIHMKLCTHIDLTELKNLCTACHSLLPTVSQLFMVLKNTC